MTQPKQTNWQEILKTHNHIKGPSLQFSLAPYLWSLPAARNGFQGGFQGNLDIQLADLSKPSPMFCMSQAGRLPGRLWCDDDESRRRRMRMLVMMMVMMMMIMTMMMILSASVVNIYSTLEYPVNSPRSQGKRSNRFSEKLTLFQEIPPASHEQNSLRPWSFCLSSFSNCRISTSNFRPWACSSKAFFSPSARHSLHQAIRNHDNHVSTFPQRKLWSQLVQVLCS